MTESFNTFPVCVRLLNLPLHLWVDSILEEVGSSLGSFCLIDKDSSNVFRTVYARILVEIDVSKGLPDMISVASPLGSWNILLDYEGIPFHCRKCRKIGHMASGCSAGKSRSKMPPSWWKGVSEEHYTVQKVLSPGDEDSLQDIVVEVSSTIPGSSAKDHPLAPLVAANQSSIPIVPSSGAFKEDPPSAPPLVSVVPSSMDATDLSSGVLGAATSLAPSMVVASSLIPATNSTAVVFPLASGIFGSATTLVGVGRSSVKGNLVMPSISVPSGSALPVSSSLDADFHVAASSLVLGISGGSDVADFWWQKAAGLVEEGWTVVKGKNIKPSSASFDMALRSHKKGSKGKA